MASPEKEYVKEYIKRMVRLNSAIENFSSTTQNDLRKLHNKILDEIKSKFQDLTMGELKKLNKALEVQLREYQIEQVKPIVDETFNEIVAREVVWVQKNLKIFAESAINATNPVSAANKALRKTYQGHTFDYWYKSNNTATTTALQNVLRQGYVVGKPTGEVVAEVSALLNRSQSDVKTLTRSYLHHASIEARQAVYEDNDDIVDGYYWVSTLDVRTTPTICGPRDGKFYNKNYEPVGHALPWDAGPGRIHFNCRSSSMAKIKGQADLRNILKRPAIGAGENYERGDNKTQAGKVRKPTKDARQKGIYEVHQTKGTTDYETFLRNEPIDFIADALGSKQLAQDFKKGQVSLYQIAMKQNVKVNTL